MELENHIVNERYDVLKSLQSGFYGTAWLSKDRKTGKDVCLKVGIALYSDTGVKSDVAQLALRPSSKRVRRS